MSLFGAMQFAEHYSDDDGMGPSTFQNSIWTNAFLRTWETNNKHITTHFMDMDHTFYNTETYIQLDTFHNSKFKYIGTFPDNIDKIDPNVTLFVNVCNPHSLPGNGQIGKLTNITWNGTPLTNPYVTYKHV
jgi:hypothetical protein